MNFARASTTMKQSHAKVRLAAGARAPKRRVFSKITPAQAQKEMVITIIIVEVIRAILTREGKSKVEREAASIDSAAASSPRCFRFLWAAALELPRQ